METCCYISFWQLMSIMNTYNQSEHCAIILSLREHTPSHSKKIGLSQHETYNTSLKLLSEHWINILKLASFKINEALARVHICLLFYSVITN